MISADIKANKNNNKLKIWWLYLTNFYKKQEPSKHEKGHAFFVRFFWVNYSS